MKRLARLLKSLSGEPALEQVGVMNAWQQVVGAPVQRKTRVLQLRDGTLFVGVTSAAWLQELTFQKDGLRQRLNEVLGRPAVQDIRFRAGIAPMGTGDQVANDEPDAPWRRGPGAGVELSAAERQRLDQLSSDIADVELQQAFRRWLSTELRWQKARSHLGWSRCSLCGVLHAGENYCPICAPGKADPPFKRIVLLLSEAPFLGLEQLRERLEGVQESAYRKAKQWLRDYWRRAVRRQAADLLDGINSHGWGDATLEREAQGLRLLLGSLTMLATGLSPEKLDSDDLRQQLTELQLGGLAPTVLPQPDRSHEG